MALGAQALGIEAVFTVMDSSRHRGLCVAVLASWTQAALVRNLAKD